MKTQKTTTSLLYTTKPYCVYENFKLQAVLYQRTFNRSH
ncbi:hypothetical protein [uncultured Gammaproteobacteria bacterium]|uniref:Uncharacterized protein n=2 Tax=Bathymodiolus azoricus thioautotrophic gill symbiont TaxID=235205 RepID=A0ACA8ZQM1_9GAMM|nr:hypothetical protein AZO1586R_1329 [Bathymodiolus azoricus thioautotrophic gill symbiont]CAC9524479.1 hypothetical protein [uncultured Gammaproteobacteria bacterium]CAC9540044.1 hypothetical protein [uncultured Gammaproteobacteria bacterium]CAC9543358.1 hypothetical protein [uncultured Gammaproteobacteria bacterium]SEH96070.1 hypothetical protein BAZSYMA_ACONTIG95710_0 [Bathymodiolus azoricus thioautotrophic gill symbiont]